MTGGQLFTPDPSLISAPAASSRSISLRSPARAAAASGDTGTCPQAPTRARVMRMAMVRISFFRLPRLATGVRNDRFHVIQVLLERAPARGGEGKFGAWSAPFESFGARHIPGVFQLAGVHAQVAVGGLGDRLD